MTQSVEIAMPPISAHGEGLQGSCIRGAQETAFKRPDNEIRIVDCAIGNVHLPTHPALQKRAFGLGLENSPFKDGVFPYSTSEGYSATNRAFRKIIESFGFSTEGLHSLITTGSSQAMELGIAVLCGEQPGGGKGPLLLIEPAYTNYPHLAKRLARPTVSVKRHLGEDGKFSLPNKEEIEKAIINHEPAALLVIPYDNPTGQFIDHETLVGLAKLCVKYNMWLVSDEAYIGLYYGDKKMTSIWAITEEDVPGITGRRVGFYSVSKILNACGLRIGSCFTDNPEIHKKLVAEMNADLCAPVIDQDIVGALDSLNAWEIQAWLERLREYYKIMARWFTDELRRQIPGIIVSEPEAAIYSVIDLRKAVGQDFNARDFIDWCARQGKVNLGGEGKTILGDQDVTLLLAPMDGFYTTEEGEENPGKTQMRVAWVETPGVMRKVPRLLRGLLEEYERVKLVVDKEGTWG